MRIYLAAAAALILLSGCTTVSPEQQFSNNQQSCGGYGFKPGTDAYAQCMMRMDMQARQEDAASTERFRQGLKAMGRAMAPPPRVTCTSMGNAQRFGNSVTGTSTTTCY